MENFLNQDVHTFFKHAYICLYVKKLFWESEWCKFFFLQTVTAFWSIWSPDKLRLLGTGQLFRQKLPI